MFGSTQYYDEPPEKIRNILNIWYRKEQPILCGKQIITQSFYYQSLVGRKVLNIVSSQNDDNLYLLLEGNIKVKLDYPSISTYNYIDTDNFKSTDIQKILYNPIYCFGYIFEPETIFLDWFDIYLYAMALLDVNLEDTPKLKASYLAFLDFIEQHVCEKIYANKSLFNQTYFWSILKIHIENINQFMKR